VSATFGEQAVAFRWSGGNSHAARLEAAQRLFAFIATHLKPGEKLNIVAHSHGGNVVKLYTQMSGSEIIDTLVTLGTPQRDDYLINAEKVEAYINAYSTNDGVQTKGGRSWAGEVGRAGRRDPSATNKDVSKIGEDKIDHGDIRSPPVWSELTK
jgi:hypothetical protein